MVVLNKIYTKTGDAGETALGNGARVAKHSMRVNAYGTVDETNATVGLARQHANGDMDAMLGMIQNDLFDLGADLCRPDMEKDKDAEYAPLRVTDAQVARLESEIDAMNGDLEPLRSFILPGGSPLAAQMHLCRTDGISKPCCGEVSQPPVRLVFRCWARGQQRRQRRCALGSGGQSLSFLPSQIDIVKKSVIFSQTRRHALDQRRF